MSPENDTPTQSTPEQPVTREREVIVTNNGGDGHRGGGFGSTLLAIVGILVVLLVGFFAIQAIGSGGDGMEIPNELDVNINDGGGDTGGQ